jgi:hypothetical protein
MSEGMSYEEAAAILGEDGVRRAREFVASFPPLSDEQVEALARITFAAAERDTTSAADDVA